MTTLTELRKELTGLLVVAELPAVDYAPGRIEPPILLVESDEPWVERGQAFGEMNANFVVLIMVAWSAENEVQWGELEALASRTLKAIFESAKWSPGELSDGYIVTANDRQWLTARVTASRQYEPTE